MDPPQVLELDEARRIGRSYGLSVARAEPVAAGRMNSNYRLSDGEGASVFLRIYEHQSAAAAQRELDLVDALARAGVSTPAPRRRQDTGSWLEESRGRPAAVFPWVEGQWLCQARVTPEICGALGSRLAELHAAIPADALLPPHRFEPKDLIERLGRARARAARELADSAAEIASQLELYAAERVPGLPSGLIHGDLFRENVLWREGSLVALVDFECAGSGRFSYDLMVSALAWCFKSEFDWSLVGGLIDGYCRSRPLGEGEIAGLGAEAAIASLRFAATRLIDFSLPAAPEQQPVRHYRRFLARLDALTRGGFDRLRAIATEASRTGTPMG